MPTDQTSANIYDPRFVRGLFDEMSKTYGLVNMISSFGFSRRWRRQCVRAIRVSAGAEVIDLMTGMGELCPDLSRHVGPTGRVRALDISPRMCEKATEMSRRLINANIVVIEGNALECPIEDNSADFVFSSFGLKTFHPEQQRELAGELHRVLKPGGEFSFLEISVPNRAILRIPYMFYLCWLIPIIGRLLMGNPDNYRLLGVYTSAFRDSRAFRNCLDEAGLVTHYQSYFFGCASGVSGSKPRSLSPSEVASDG